MSLQRQDTHTLIDRQLIVYRRKQSDIWQCRYSVDGVWQRTSTQERTLKEAKKRAHEILIKANVRKEMNHAPITRIFRDVAKNAILKMQRELGSGEGRVIYKDYMALIKRYLIPFLGKYRIDNIDASVMQQFGVWREVIMGGKMKHSTLLNHNAALNYVFNVAVEEGFMVESNRPKLLTKGRQSLRRADFSATEASAVLHNFDLWITQARVDQIALRELLKDYVIVLLDTGARPGKELLDLKWSQIEVSVDPEIKRTGNYDEDGDEIIEHDFNRSVILHIQTGKTGKRLAYGREPTVRALSSIIKRNYGDHGTDIGLKRIAALPKIDYVFRSREYLNEEQRETSKESQLIKPTSFSKLFDNYLTSLDLMIDPITGQNRVFYSLRHTYATLALTHDKVPIHTLAEQMGTSVTMIERHYSHLNIKNASEQLRGQASRALLATQSVDLLKHTYKSKAVKKSVKK